MLSVFLMAVRIIVIMCQL